MPPPITATIALDMPDSLATFAATSRPVAAMNPTMTEHDFRFPRRPGNGAQAPADAGRTNQASDSISAHVEADREQKLSAVNDQLFGDALFPSLDSAASGPGKSIDQLQDDDPLAAQVWRFFTKTKQQLPNQQRLENLTWRMMALSMRKKKQEEEAKQSHASQNRYAGYIGRRVVHMYPCLGLRCRP